MRVNDYAAAIFERPIARASYVYIDYLIARLHLTLPNERAFHAQGVETLCGRRQSAVGEGECECEGVGWRLHTHLADPLGREQYCTEKKENE